MSVYDSGVSAYRDTTKWLVAFVPIGSLIAAAVTLGPDLVLSIQTARSAGDWFSDNWLVATCGVVLMLGISAIVVWGARVLSVAPTDIGEIQGQDYAQRLATAVGAGVTAPEFFTTESFNTQMAALANAWDQPTPTAGDELRLARLQGAVEKLRLWSIFDRVQTQFNHFVVAFVLGTVAVGVAIVLAPAQLGQGLAVDKPTEVQVDVSDTGQKDLAAETGCTDFAMSTFVAVGGTWQRPLLTADGPGCQFGATWLPDPDEIEVRSAPALASQG